MASDDGKGAKPATLGLPMGISLGLMIGTVLGLTVLDDLAIGMAFGIAIGAGLGSTTDLVRRSRHDPPKDEPGSKD